jgi:hypothetical protein
MPYVKPNPSNKNDEGLPIQVYDPARGRFLPVVGDFVPNNAYWGRRIAEGSVIVTEPKKNKKAGKVEKAETEQTKPSGQED